MHISNICLFFSWPSSSPLNELFSVIEKWHSPNDVRENAKTSSKCKNHSVFEGSIALLVLDWRGNHGRQ